MKRFLRALLCAALTFVTVAGSASDIYAYDMIHAQWYLSGGFVGKDTVSGGIYFDEMDITLEDVPVVAVIDTGVDYTNPDLIGRMWENPYDELPGTYGYDFGDDDDDPMDVNGHGTHCAGIIAANGSDRDGITGIADARIMALKVMNEKGFITISNILRAFEYVYTAKKLGVNVVCVNCSFGGGSDSSKALEHIIDMLGEEGVLTFCAAGNDGKDVAEDEILKLQFPQCIDSDYLLMVGALDENNMPAAFSNYSTEYVDVYAPGVDIVSDSVSKMFVPFFKEQQDRTGEIIYYNKLSGASDPENVIPVGSEAIYTAADIGVLSDYKTDMEILTDKGFMGEGGCVKITMEKTEDVNYNDCFEKGNTDFVGISMAALFIDVTDLGLDQNSYYYFGAMYGEQTAGGDITWNSTSVLSSPKHSRFYEVGDRVYFVTIGTTTEKTGVVSDFYIDNMSISKADLSSDTLQQAVSMSGTSMSAPVAAGVYAMFRAGNLSLDALSAKEIFLTKCVTKRASVKNLCASGGIVDASKIFNRVTKVSLNTTSKTVRFSKTKTLKLKASVYPVYATNAKLTWKSSNTAYATVSSTGKVRFKKAGVGHSVKISATAKDGSGYKAVCKIKIKA